MGKSLFSELQPSRIVRPFENKERIILRDYLALQRTSLANERTLLSYIRISLYLVIGGIGLMNVKELEHLIWLAYVSFGISAILLIYGIIRYSILRIKLRTFYDTIGLPEFEDIQKQ